MAPEDRQEIGKLLSVHVGKQKYGFPKEFGLTEWLDN